MPSVPQYCSGACLLLLLLTSFLTDVNSQSILIFFTLSVFAISLVLTPSFPDSTIPPMESILDAPVPTLESTDESHPSTSMQLPIENLRSQLTENQILFPWSDKKSPQSPTVVNDWKTRPFPAELELLPDGDDTPFELVEIFRKSLLKSDSARAPSICQQGSPTQTEQENQSPVCKSSRSSISVESAEHESSIQKPRIEELNLPNQLHETQDTGRKNKLSLKPSFLNSAIDLLGTIKVKLDEVPLSKSTNAKPSAKKPTTMSVLRDVLK